MSQLIFEIKHSHRSDLTSLRRIAAQLHDANVPAAGEGVRRRRSQCQRHRLGASEVDDNVLTSVFAANIRYARCTATHAKHICCAIAVAVRLREQKIQEFYAQLTYVRIIRIYS